MRTVEVSRFVRGSPAEVERLLGPGTIIEYEGTFTVRDVEETDDGWRVTAGATGMEAVFDFEETSDGYRYVQATSAGPFDELETTVSVGRENEGVRVTMTSTASLRLPPRAITDRIAAWKRRGELRRALRRLAADVE